MLSRCRISNHCREVAAINRKLGILGGMGPKATAVFMDKIIEHTDADRDQDHLDMIIVNHATLPDRTTVILEQRKEEFLTAVERDLQLLAYAEATHIAIPCNTSHYFYDELQAMSSVPIIHMVDETVQVMAGRFGRGSKIGLLATNGTVRSGVYKRICERHGMELHLPDEATQNQVMRIIYHDVKGGVTPDPAVFERIILNMIKHDQCSGVIIACTELSCIPISAAVNSYCVDAMDVLVRKSIELSGKRYK